MVNEHPDYAFEKKHLDDTINEMKVIVSSLENDVEKRVQQMRLSLEYKDQVSSYVHSMMKNDNIDKIYDIQGAFDSPYFGRVDFREDETPDYEKFYIGRVKISRLEINGIEDILVFDWRDPVATIFYECQDGRASYDVLGRYYYHGDVNLKRQYKIANGILEKISDDYIWDQVTEQETVISDPFLTERLLQGTSNKLKDIVTSIRAEQNKIIRETLNQVIIIQGVAGSGKSTIGLHRLSYLLYNEKLDPRKMIVIAPNKIFLDYICELLPEIDANDVGQSTFIDLVAMIIQEKITLHKDEKNQLFLEHKVNNARREQLSMVAKLKGSLDFIKVLEAWQLKKIEKFCLKVKEIKLFDGQLIIGKEEQIAKVMEGNHLIISYNERLGALIGYIKFKVRNFLEVLEARQKQAKGETDKTFLQYKKQGMDFLERHFKDWLIHDLLVTYKEIFRDKSIYKAVRNKKYDVAFITEHSLEILGAGTVEKEDLAPLCYLKYLVDGFHHVARFEHIVVDEAQDLNGLEFYILRLLSRNSSFTIMGDMSQGIISYRSIDNWQVLMKEVFADVKSIYREVNYSYRSAREIVECFNSVMPKGYSAAIPVYEIGRQPIFEQVTTNQETIAAIIKAIRSFEELGCKSIGIITKLERDSLLIYHTLKREPFNINNINLITNDTTEYQGGISILPISLAKGLEFDGVIIGNASDKEFKEHSFDQKLLYVALSRALYYLYILYRGTITPLLKKYT